MIYTENLCFHYNDQEPLMFFPDISLNSGQDLLILGKSGVGKTTLLHLLAGLLTPVEGRIIIENTEVSKLKVSERDFFRGQQIGLVFQKNYAIQSLSVAENLSARLYLSKKKAPNTFVSKLLSELDIEQSKNKKINQLSEGQLQRLGIALAVVHQPKIILADEPTSSLDDENCEIVLGLLQQQAALNKANLVVITHDQRVKGKFKNMITL